MLPTINYETTVDIPDHQVLFSFNGDEDALNFFHWWHHLGESLYKESLEKNDQ